MPAFSQPFAAFIAGERATKARRYPDKSTAASNETVAHTPAKTTPCSPPSPSADPRALPQHLQSFPPARLEACRAVCTPHMPRFFLEGPAGPVCVSVCFGTRVTERERENLSVCLSVHTRPVLFSPPSSHQQVYRYAYIHLTTHTHTHTQTNTHTHTHTQRERERERERERARAPAGHAHLYCLYQLLQHLYLLPVHLPRSTRHLCRSLPASTRARARVCVTRTQTSQKHACEILIVCAHTQAHVSCGHSAFKSVRTNAHGVQLRSRRVSTVSALRMKSGLRPSSARSRSCVSLCRPHEQARAWMREEWEMFAGTLAPSTVFARRLSQRRGSCSGRSVASTCEAPA